MRPTELRHRGANVSRIDRRGRADTVRTTPFFTVLIAIMMALASLPMGIGSAAATRSDAESSGSLVSSIVILADGADPAAAARAMGVRPTHIYRYVFTGFAAELPAATLTTARNRSDVRRIDPDGEVTVQGTPGGREGSSQADHEVPSTGFTRIGTPTSAEQQDFDGTDVAVIDTGVAKHPDLNVAGGHSCITIKTKKGTRKMSPFKDGYGHGTHVAGIIGAQDNLAFTIGVAPNVRIWAVKVFKDTGSGRWSDVVCGLDWVARHADTIDAVNMSLGGPGRKGPDCDSSGLRRAVCTLVNDHGIPVVVAASNESSDASGYIPAAYPEAIVVSAFGDTNGEIRPETDEYCDGNQDDHFADVSNFGQSIDISAPGVCIESLWPEDRTKSLTGTSMAAPHVTGAIARFLNANPDATEAEVENWLQSDEASRPQLSDEGFIGDPDAFPERVLYIADM